MSDLRELYQELILEHARSPRNFRDIAGAQHAEGFNPLCGDHFTVYVVLDGATVRDIAFQGQGCAISTASASVMTETVKGHTSGEVATLFEGFHDLVTGKAPATAELPPKLTVFSGVSEYPARVKCASLAWHALNLALAGKSESVSTE